jgi:uncharacterized protein YfaQ (DUF2300 family)
VIFVADSILRKFEVLILKLSFPLICPFARHHLTAEVPGQTLDQAGNACMIVLPSDKPSNRAEALAVEKLLMDLWQLPDQSCHK